MGLAVAAASAGPTASIPKMSIRGGERADNTARTVTAMKAPTTPGVTFGRLIVRPPFRMQVGYAGFAASGLEPGNQRPRPRLPVVILS
ncbi:hypothetical protein Aca07nite_69260 [Actinoplanes capillaceus]|uniref:Uncharacterized protein n=1 Tax=Actinoplanes campanulatus TaxID=113559 RepID=A0ABQ3WTN9_9ACTN|nr:hypothetical protein Aca07nite_69260 [Actinoplanes capillaceus]